MTSCASRMASIMVILAMASEPRLLPLAPEMRRHLLVNIDEHVTRRCLESGVHRSEALSLFLGGDDLGLNFGGSLSMSLFGPELLEDEMVFETLDWITERPRL